MMFLYILTLRGSDYIFGGELGFKVKSIIPDRYFVRPTEASICIFNDKKEPSNDLSLKFDGGTLHICGDNDWAFLALEILKPIKEEALKIIETAHRLKSENKYIRAFALGKNDKRIMDVFMGGKDKCKKILGLPVIVSDNFNEVTGLIDYIDILPF